jgi:hypothetical protein
VHSLRVRGGLFYSRIRAAYGDAKYEPLVALKTVYDPDNVFRLNQNIPPRSSD